MVSRFSLSEAYCNYLLYKDLSAINLWDDDLRLELWKLMKPARTRETQELLQYLDQGYRIAFVTPDFNHYRKRLDDVFTAYPKLKKTDCICITFSQDFSKILGIPRDKIVIVVLANARIIYNLIDHVNWLEKAGYIVLYEATS